MLLPKKFPRPRCYESSDDESEFEFDEIPGIVRPVEEEFAFDESSSDDADCTTEVTDSEVRPAKLVIDKKRNQFSTPTGRKHRIDDFAIDFNRASSVSLTRLLEATVKRRAESVIDYYKIKQVKAKDVKYSQSPDDNLTINSTLLDGTVVRYAEPAIDDDAIEQAKELDDSSSKSRDGDFTIDSDELDRDNTDHVTDDEKVELHSPPSPIRVIDDSIFDLDDF